MYDKENKERWDTLERDLIDADLSGNSHEHRKYAIERLIEKLKEMDERIHDLYLHLKLGN